MFNLLKIFTLISVSLLVSCEDFKCPATGSKGGKKVPDILSLIEKQNGYYSTVEVNNKDHENLVHEHYDVDRKVGFIDLEAMNQNGLNRRYYYHDTQEKIVIRQNQCTRLDLDQTEKVESVKDWFEPKDIVDKSEIFKDFVHFGPSVLMIYAHSISDKASFVGTELIDGRSIDHWFYCFSDSGPYIDFYFDSVSSYPYRFSLFYPKMETQGNETVQGRDSEYVYNFFVFRPLFISQHEPIPYPIGYGCTRKDSPWKTELPDFAAIQKFSLDMEAIITYDSGEIIKSTARVMKHHDIYSYEITEDDEFVRSIENPPPLGRWEINERTGKCKYYTAEYYDDITLVTRWPFFTDRGFNILYYTIMKSPPSKYPTFIGTIDLGPERIEEYRVSSLFINSVDAIVDYHYPVSNNSIDPDNVPARVVIHRDPESSNTDVPKTVEVTIISFSEDFFSYEDRFDISECYQDFGQYTWFQLVFSNPYLTTPFSDQMVRESVHDFLTEFIPITRISDIVINNIDSNTYVNVKLLERVHFIEAYHETKNYKVSNADRTMKHWRVEDCEESCSVDPACTEFSYCKDFTCSILTNPYMVGMTDYDVNCTTYSIDQVEKGFKWYQKNLLSPNRFVLHEIRRKVAQNELYVSGISSTAEEMFIVHGPEELGDLAEDDFKGPPHFFRGDNYPVIQGGRKYDSGIATEIKVDYMECIRLCQQDDDCNSVSHCPNQKQECILSKETSITLKDSLETATVKADGCNIYEKSFMSYFQKYPGKSLVVDAATTLESVEFTDCAKECIKSKDFNCESFDYCSAHFSKNDSVCFLHVHHITADPTHEVNASNWKYAANGCDHFSKKSEHDYAHITAHQLSPSAEIIETHDEGPLEDCAARCNTNPNGCYTFEFCEVVENVQEHSDYYFIPESTWIKTTCRLSNARPRTTTNTKDPDFKKYFDKSLESQKICSVYVNQDKIYKSYNDKDQFNRLVNQQDRTSLAVGLGSFFFILAFVAGVAGFTYAYKTNLISL